jgi:hypothetical protein
VEKPGIRQETEKLIKCGGTEVNYAVRIARALRIAK